MTTLIDIGVNLTNPRFAADLDAVLERALAAGVTGVIVTGTSLAGSREAVALCRAHGQRFPGLLYATAGIHPHEAASCNPEALAALAAVIRDNPGTVVAVGETGLDFNRNFSPPEAQVAAFEQQLELAMATGLPLFLHERDAHHRQLDILRAAGNSLPPGVIHCFTGDRRSLDNYLELGLQVGITGWLCDERRGLELQGMVAAIPRNRLLVETDAPYLLPRTLRPRPKNNRNEPAYLPAVVEMLAACRRESVADIASATTANARRLFRLPADIINPA